MTIPAYLSGIVVSLKLQWLRITEKLELNGIEIDGMAGIRINYQKARYFLCE